MFTCNFTISPSLHPLSTLTKQASTAFLAIIPHTTATHCNECSHQVDWSVKIFLLLKTHCLIVLVLFSISHHIHFPIRQTWLLAKRDPSSSFIHYARVLKHYPPSMRQRVKKNILFVDRWYNLLSNYCNVYKCKLHLQFYSDQ